MKIIKNSKNYTADVFQSGLYVKERESTFRNHVHQLLNEEADYPVQFLAYLKPFFTANANHLTDELMLYMGMMAWNFANVRHMAPGFYHDFKLNAGNERDIPAELTGDFEKLMERKESLFSKFNSFIIDYERVPLYRKSKDNWSFDLKLTLKTRNEFLTDHFLQTMYFTDKEVVLNESTSDFSSGFINRSIVLIYPTSIFFNFHRNLPLVHMKLQSENGSMFLVPESEQVSTIDKWVRRNYRIILEKFFLNFDIDDAHIPQHMTYKLFIEWFDIEILKDACDLVQEPVVKYHGRQ